MNDGYPLRGAVGKSGPAHPRWKGGCWKRSDGRYMQLAKGHHRANKQGYVYRYILVAEQKLGRPLLPNEEVHHDNENVSDDHPDNLIVMTKRQHASLHSKERVKTKPRNPRGEFSK